MRLILGSSERFLTSALLLISSVRCVIIRFILGSLGRLLVGKAYHFNREDEGSFF